MKHRINVFSSVQIYVACFGYIFCHRAVRFLLQSAIVEIQTAGQGRMWAWILLTLQSFVIILTFFFHTEQITWQLDGVQYSEMFTFDMMVASHHMISKPKRYNYRNPPRLFMYSLPHAQRTPKISSIKNCALLLLHSLYRQFPKDIFQKYLWEIAGVCYI